jgi:hypothetical protein
MISELRAGIHQASRGLRRRKVSSRALQPPHLTILVSHDRTSYGA